MVLDRMLSQKAASPLDRMLGKTATCGAAHAKPKPKRKVRKKALKKLAEKMAAWHQPAEQILKLEGSQSDKARQALDALCTLTPERDHPFKEAGEKRGFYTNVGEKVHVKSGPHKGENGRVEARTRVRHEERWLDDEGSDNEKRKTDESVTVSLPNNTQVTFDKPDEELEDYRADKDKTAADDRMRQAVLELREKAACCGCSSGPYYSLGEKARCTKGEHEGCTAVVTKIVEHDEESWKTDDEGAVVNRSKSTKTLTLKKDDGSTFEVEAKDTERPKDDEDMDPEPAEVTASEKDELVETVEKIGRILSQRILNGDVGLQDVINAFATPKEADSKTAPAKAKNYETQEGVGEWPKGDDKPPAAGLKTLRVEDKPSNITDVDKAIDEAQDTDKVETGDAAADGSPVEDPVLDK